MEVCGDHGFKPWPMTADNIPYREFKLGRSESIYIAKPMDIAMGEPLITHHMDTYFRPYGRSKKSQEDAMKELEMQRKVEAKPSQTWQESFVEALDREGTKIPPKAYNVGAYANVKESHWLLSLSLPIPEEGEAVCEFHFAGGDLKEIIMQDPPEKLEGSSQD
jgi:hypothetical protein